MTQLYNIKIKNALGLLLCTLLQTAGLANEIGTGNFSERNDNPTVEKNRCNFYVFTKDGSRKLDFLGYTVLVRLGFKKIFVKKKLYVIVAKNSCQVTNKIIAILNKQHALVGNIWFDSHGLYEQGYSSFHIGSDEFSYKNIHDTGYTCVLKQLAGYCDTKSNIGLGSCYAGATFNFPGSAIVPAGRMNGDSLMIGVGKIFSGSTIYGSESWVMMKPGIFNDNFGFAGYPLGKKYRTKYWQPVWERLGKWNRYNAECRTIESINTVALNNQGAITVRARNYQELKKGKNAIESNLAKLQNTGYGKLPELADSIPHKTGTF
jgi:hypothetical protein